MVYPVSFEFLILPSDLERISVKMLNQFQIPFSWNRELGKSEVKIENLWLM